MIQIFENRRTDASREWMEKTRESATLPVPTLAVIPLFDSRMDARVGQRFWQEKKAAVITPSTFHETAWVTPGVTEEVSNFLKHCVGQSDDPPN
jgi:hypothetical protein